MFRLLSLAFFYLISFFVKTFKYFWFRRSLTEAAKIVVKDSEFIDQFF